MSLRQIFASTEPTSVEAAERRRKLAEAMQVKALQGTKTPLEYYTPAAALADLGTTLVSAWSAKKATSPLIARSTRSRQLSHAAR